MARPKVLEMSLAKASAARGLARSLSWMTFLGGTLWGSRDRMDVRSFEGSMQDVDAWESRFGERGDR
ncbi:MAG: hypothetical protein AB8I08_09365 [Sandaracinaceae bacterium]